MKLTITVVSLSLALFACSKKEEDKGKGKTKSGKTKSGTTKTGETKSEAKMTAKTIASMKLTIDVPADANVDDNTKRAHFPSATIYASPTIFVTGQNEMFWKKDLAAQKKDIEKSPGNKFKKFTKETPGKDGGFHLEYELISMDDKPLYSFHIRRKIGDKLVDCHTNTSSEAARKKGIKMCMTLRPAK